MPHPFPWFSGIRRLSALSLLVTSAFATLTLAAATAAQAAPLVSGLGGPRGYGENVLAANDDGFTGLFPIGSVFPSGLNFYGTTYFSLSVNNNGHVTFNSGSGDFTPDPMNTAPAMIAMWWGDIDTRGAHVPPDSNLVYYDLDAGNGILTITWDAVGYFPEHADLLNSFQLRLIDRGGGDFDIEYRYADLQWADDAGAGFSAGNGVDFFEFAESRNVTEMPELVSRSNTGIPGLFRFSARSGEIAASSDSCNDGNGVGGDGCSAGGQVEDCWTCTGDPSVCTPQAPTITTVDSAGLVGRYANMAIGSDGLPVIAYYDDTNDSIKVAHCNDAGCTSSTKSVVDATVGNFINWQHGVRIIIGSDGLPFLAYHHAATGKIGIAHCSDVACVNPPAINTLDTRPSLSGAEPGLALGSDGFPFITHGESAANQRRAIHCLDATCSSRNADVMSSFYRYGHTTLGQDGFPLNAHGQGDRIRISKCSTRDCTSSVTSTDVLVGGGGTPWIAATDIEIAPDGLGFFTYHDGETGELRVARCSDAACTSVSTSLVDGAVGLTEGLAASSSIVFGSDGRARIAYYDTDDGNLRLAECLDASCATSSLRTMDSTGDVGRDASMVRSGSRLLISYFDTTNSDLKVAYCPGTSGNGSIDGSEQCDDGDLVSGDGCDASGQVETCYDCTGAPSVCTSHCGDGVLDPDEDCDDGDLVSGDGCSATGQVESCYTCSGQPSVCTANCGDDGALDPTFDTDGKVTTVFTSGIDQIRDVAFQADDKIVAVGPVGPVGSRDFGVARYNPDGSLDTTFSGDGKLAVGILGDDLALGVAIQDDGKIVVCGSADSSASNLALLRLNTDGTPDTTFSGDGIQTTDLGVYEQGFDVAIQTDGKIVVGGTRGDGIQNDALIARYNSNGTIDTTFSGDGVDILDVWGGSTTELPYAVAIQTDGKILLGGSSILGGVQQFTLLRYNTNGTLDTSFSGDGKAAMPVGTGVATIRGLVLQPDGKIVAAGDATGSGSNADFAVARFNSDGSPDTTFSGDGKLLTSFGSADDAGRSVALRGDGRIVVAGYGDMSGKWNFAVARYLADGQLDSSFAGDGRATTAVGAGQDTAFGVAIDSTGRTVAAGQSYDGSSSAFALVRYAEAICGDGTAQAGESCDDGNVDSGDCCSAACQVETAGTACESDENVCTTDLCDGSGTCVHAAGNAGTTCRSQLGECDAEEVCDGTSTSCPADAQQPGGTPCTDDSNVCTTDLCDGSGTCVHAAGNAGTTCRGLGGVCDVVEVCDGVSTSCPSDAKSSGVCRVPGGVCDIAESCDGVSNSCPADAKVPNGTICTSDGNPCTDDVCNGVADVCTHPDNSASCDDGEFCNGADTCGGGSCSVHVGDPCAGGSECAHACNETADNCFDTAGTGCTADGNVCTDDVCDGSGGCGVNNTASCDDEVFCNGADTCSDGICTHAGSPCPETDCNHCQEEAESCFDPELTACTADTSDCTFDRCDGSGACTHPPIPLAEVCNYAIIGGSDTVTSKVRTRANVVVDGAICTDKGDAGLDSVLLGDSSWVFLHETSTAAKIRGAMLDEGDAVTGGGCLKATKGLEVFETGLNQICCTESPAATPGGGFVDTCGEDPQLDECRTAKQQVAGDLAMLEGLASTATLPQQSCTPELPCTITGSGGVNVIDIPRINIAVDGVLTIDAGGDPDKVFVLRLANGIRGKLGGSVVLAGGAQAKNVAFYAADGNCEFGDQSTGAGTLFCPNGKVRMKVGSIWTGAVASGKSVDLGDNVVLTHEPFLGLAE